jgi:hypothetical protein
MAEKKRVLISDKDAARLTKALIELKDWEKAKAAALPDVDPKVLDKGWKKFCFEKAGLKLEGADAAEKAAVEKAAAEKKTGAKPKDPLA